ncbi:hypothetical protein PHYBOEH_003936 [Phytophthora boehmeriae]|uniref:CSC1/OSCA1-like cytosolic domain-containing protein n=1 Tax=Phytophthora boehmeriae TaxID=109152 RepID=A0A8T1WPF2_9STRA|nr:hypothetical protein PHYBOEH_003936 [Phytophthora boehmeriae]
MTTQEDAAAANANPSGTLKTSLSIYFSILGAGLLLFELLRRRFRRAYNSRLEEEALYSSSFDGKHHTQMQLAAQVEEQERDMGSFDDGHHVQLRDFKEFRKHSYEMDSNETPLLGQRSPAEQEQQLRNNLGGDSEHDRMDEKKARRREREMSQEEREQVRKEHPIRVMRQSAFISFTSLMSAQVAQQTLQSKDPVCMAVTPAPHASDINWDNIGLRYRTRALGALVSLLISGIIVLFWTIPTAFVASLSTKAPAPVIAVVVLVVIVLVFNYFVITLYPPVAKYLPLMQCVRLDSERGLHDAKAPQFFFLDNVYRQPAMNEKAPIRADYRMLINNYGEDTMLSPEIYTPEDQHLFSSVV